MRLWAAIPFCCVLLFSQTTAKEWLAQGDRQFTAHQFADAKRSFLQAAAVNQLDFLPHRAIGLCELELRDYNAAYREWLKALELKPDDTRTKYYLGRLFYEADLPNEAAIYLRQVVERTPDDYAALTYLGLSAEATGLEDTARDLYRKAIYESNQQRKPYSWAYLALANLYTKRGNEEQARLALTEAEERCPEAQALSALGDLLAKAGEKTRAEAVLRRSITLEPTLPKSHYRLALLLKTDGKENESRSEMELFQQAKAREAALPKPQALRR